MAAERLWSASVTPWLRGMLAALAFLTCIPLPRGAQTASRDLTRALPFFPLVGLLFGCLAVLLDAALQPLFALHLRNALVIAMQVLLSGALHLDGLTDTADGLFRPGTSEQRLAAMRESWAGPRGSMAAVTLILLQFAALEALPADVRSAALMLSPTLARWAVVYSYVAFPYARHTAGLSRSLKDGASWPVLLAATTIPLLLVAALNAPSALLLLAGVWLTSAAIASAVRRALGGLTGDVYGAIEQIVEVLVLLLAPATLAGWRLTP